MNLEDYPKRPPYFANLVIRLMTKAAASQTMGPEACWLVTVVAMQEDAKRYREPANFYNEQLMPLIGANGRNALERVRARAVEAGWLAYRPGRKRTPGLYWALLPAFGESMTDGACDESDGFLVQNRTGNKVEIPAQNSSSGSKTDGQADLPVQQQTDNLGFPSEIGSESGRKVDGQAGGKWPSNPASPIPIPTPLPNPEYTPPCPNEGESDRMTFDLESELIQAWNASDGVVKHRGEQLTPKRRKTFQVRIRDPGWDWRAAIQKFPLQMVVSQPDGWKPDVEWFLRPDSVLQILEGKYDWSKSNGSQKRIHSGSGHNFDPNAENPSSF